MPNLTPDDGTRYAKTIADLYSDATAELLRVVARRLAAGVDQPGWAEAKLSELLRLRRDAATVVGRTVGGLPDVVEKALTDAYEAASGVGVVATNRRAVEALARDLAGTLRATDTGVLRAVEDIYRRVVADTASQTVTGALDRRAATAKALDRFAAAGVGGFVDTAGRRWQLDTYAEMAARTATARAHLQGGIDRMVQDGRDLVIVSDAPEECGLCRPLEGRILSLSGTPPTGLPAGFEYAGSLDQARAAGLFHPNCRHSLAAYVPGLTRQFGPTADPDGDRLRQRQRALERRVRESKRRVATLEQLGDTPVLRQQKALLRDRQAALSRFVDSNDRKAWLSEQRTRVNDLPGRGPAETGLAGRVRPPGEPGHSLRDVPDGKPKAWVDHAMRAAARVHAEPDGMTSIPVSTFHRPESAVQAQYLAVGRPGQGPGGLFFGSKGIEVNTAARNPHASIVHEYGHFLDHRGIGEDLRFTSAVERDGLLAGFWRAVEASPTYRSLQEMRAHDNRRPWAVLRLPGEDEDRVMYIDRKFVEYLLDPREVFARTYAQWIAEQSGDELLRRQIAAMVRPQPADYEHIGGGPVGYPHQWESAEFAAIGGELQAVFRRAGLLRGGG